MKNQTQKAGPDCPICNYPTDWTHTYVMQDGQHHGYQCGSCRRTYTVRPVNQNDQVPSPARKVVQNAHGRH